MNRTTQWSADLGDPADYLPSRRSSPPDDVPPPAGPEDYDLPPDGEREGQHETSTARTRQPQTETPPSAGANLITPADWPDEMPPPIEWLVDQRIPRGDVTSLHGDGGAGKTDIAIQLAAACAADLGGWLGHVIQHGPTVFISAEEPEREMRRRLGLHATRDRFALSKLHRMHFWFPDDVAGAALGIADKGGTVKATPMFDAIKTSIEAVAPILVVADNVAATFVGNQLDRVQARGFVNLWRTVAHGPSKPAVLLLDHPSLSGLTSGTGRGGNMDWRNAVRSALYLHAPDDKAEAEAGVRILETAKSNYTKPGNPLRLRWANGGLVLESSGSFERMAADADVDHTFLQLLDQVTAQGRNIGPNTGRNYAPSVFENMPGAKSITARAFARAQERLLATGRLQVESVGPPSKRISILKRKGAA